MKPVYYASGTNKPGEVRGMARAGRDIGVAADQCIDRGCLPALVEIASRYPKTLVFIDSGAFSEVSANPKTQKKAGLKPQPGVLLTVAPISKAEWKRRLELMQRAGKALGGRLLVMAPDKVGDQKETLERLRWFKKSGWLDRLRKTGMEIAVVLQGGKLDPVAFDKKVAKALGWDGYAIAFPMMKGATSLKLIQAYVAARAPRRVHLLGIGPKARKLEGKPSAAEVKRGLFERFPRTGWSWDSALIRQSVGRTADREAVYTDAQDIERQAIHAEALAGQVKVTRGVFKLDWTDIQDRPSSFLLDYWKWPATHKCVKELQAKPRRADTPHGRKTWVKRKAKWDKCRADFRARAEKTARTAGLQGDEIDLFIADPDAFSKGKTDPNPLYDQNHPRMAFDPVFANALEGAFDKWLGQEARYGGPPEVAELLSERASYLAFQPGGPAKVAVLLAELTGKPDPRPGPRFLPGISAHPGAGTAGPGGRR